MKKILLLILVLIALMPSASATEREDSLTSIVERIIDREFKTKLRVDFCTSMNGSFTDGAFDEAYMKLNRVRFDFKSNFSDMFSYRIRYSFNKSFVKNSLENVAPALEYANIQWHPDNRFKMTIGKQFINIAGYEALGNSLYIREFADFNNSVSFYRVAVTAAFYPDQDRNHEITLQITNNREKKDSEIYSYGLPDGVNPTKFPFLYSVRWNGFMADRKINLIYGAAVGPLAQGRNSYYLTCANVYDSGPIMTYLDIMYSREGIDNQQRITSLQKGMPVPATAQCAQYLSFIAKFDYRFHPKWNAYVKGAYETGSIYESNSIFAYGRYMTTWNAQASVECKPFTKDGGFKVFLHYIYRGTSLSAQAAKIGAAGHDIQRLSMGVIYELPVL